MRHFRRHWRLVVVTFVVVMLGTRLLLWHEAPPSVAWADPQDPVPVDAIEYSAILTLLEDVRLDREVLVALNLNSTQAEAILQDVRDWNSDNAATLSSLRAGIDQARAQLRSVRAAIDAGPAQEDQQQTLAAAVQQLVNAKAAYQSQLASLKTDVQAELSESQVAAWGAAEAGWGMGMPLRMLDLSDAQRVELNRAWRQYRWQYNAASTGAERAGAVAAWEAKQADVLSQDQEAVIAAYEGYYDTASGVVASAFDTTLPRSDS